MVVCWNIQAYLMEPCNDDLDAKAVNINLIKNLYK